MRLDLPRTLRFNQATPVGNSTTISELRRLTADDLHSLTGNIVLLCTFNVFFYSKLLLILFILSGNVNHKILKRFQFLHKYGLSYSTTRISFITGWFSLATVPLRSSTCTASQIASTTSIPLVTFPPKTLLTNQRKSLTRLYAIQGFVIVKPNFKQCWIINSATIRAEYK